jgi:Protein of unknown function (DUF4241)
MMASAPALAELFMRGAHDVALRELRAGPPDLAHEVARLVGPALSADAREHWNVCPRERTWANHQLALLALARVPGVDQRELATELTEAVHWQRIDGVSPLEPEVFAWMIEWAPDQVYEAAEEQISTGFRFVRAALFAHPDERARRWMVDWFRTNPTTARFEYSAMRTGRMRSTWSAEEWSRRMHALCDAELPESPLLFVDDGLPPETSVAQVRLACTYASSPVDHTLRAVARNVRAYAAGDAVRDAELFWWAAEGSTVELLRQILELSGPPGARADVVAAAFGSGRIDEATRDFLAADVPRPAWADGDVEWEIDEIAEPGMVVVPDGRLSGADPYWGFEGVRFEVTVPPGSYPVRVFEAIHPLLGRACAAAELIVDPEAEVARWERLGVRESPREEFGYRVEVGVGSFGAARALTEASVYDLAPLDDYLGSRVWHAAVDADELGSFVMFSVGPQHQLCRTWAGYTAEGLVARVLTDLGLIHLNPEANPDDPLRPGRPWDESVGPLPPSELERRTGIVRGERWTPRSDTGLEQGTVTVIEVYMPDHNWLRTLAVWYAWDDSRAGNLMAAAEFERRFTRMPP